MVQTQILTYLCHWNARLVQKYKDGSVYQFS